MDTVWSKNKHGLDKVLKESEFFIEYKEAYRYNNLKFLGRGSFGVVCAATDTNTGERVAIKRITGVFADTASAIQTLREVKLLKILQHPNIVKVKRIMLPSSRHDFSDIYVVFELMDGDLKEVIKSNATLTHDHHLEFLSQMLRALKYMHRARVYHQDLKPSNILVNAESKLKICDFGLARVEFNDAPSAMKLLGTKYYRAPELCGSPSSKCTPAIDIWSIGCIFAEVLTRNPLFPGENDLDQLELMTDLLGKPSPETISEFQDEETRKYLARMRIKKPAPLSEKIPNANPLALDLLQSLLAFDAKDRPSAEEALAHPYFNSARSSEKEPSCPKISKLEFKFESQQLAIEEFRQLMFQEILEYKKKDDGINLFDPRIVHSTSFFTATPRINSGTTAQEFRQNVSVSDIMHKSRKVNVGASHEDYYWDRTRGVVHPLWLRKGCRASESGRSVKDPLKAHLYGQNPVFESENYRCRSNTGRIAERAASEAKKFTSQTASQRIQRVASKQTDPVDVDIDGNHCYQVQAGSSLMDSERGIDAGSQAQPENVMSEAKDGKDLEKAMSESEAKKCTSKPVGQTTKKFPLEQTRQMGIDIDGNPCNEAAHAESRVIESETGSDGEVVQEQSEKLERLHVD